MKLRHIVNVHYLTQVWYLLSTMKRCIVRKVKAQWFRRVEPTSCNKWHRFLYAVFWLSGLKLNLPAFTIISQLLEYLAKLLVGNSLHYFAVCHVNHNKSVSVHWLSLCSLKYINYLWRHFFLFGRNIRMGNSASQSSNLSQGLTGINDCLRDSIVCLVGKNFLCPHTSLSLRK